jgi:hypothetical protein
VGKISDIYTAYKKSLDRSQHDYERSVRDRATNAKKLYDGFFKDLTVNYGKFLKSRVSVMQVTEAIRSFFGGDEINFVAVDGSCDKHESAEFVSFYGGAYGSKGTLSLSKAPPKIEYKKWEIEKDVSMVAFVPIAYSQIDEVTDSVYQEKFLSDSQKIDLANIHLRIMQLAEVFLAYNTATSSLLDHPNLILLDNSVSTMLGSVDLQPDKVQLVGYPFERRFLTLEDVAVAQAHPINLRLGIPSAKNFTADYAIISYLHRNRGIDKVKLGKIESEFGIPEGRYHRAGIRRLVERKIITFDESAREITKLIDPWESWEYVKLFFQNVCQRIFLDKSGDALKYPTKDYDGYDVMRWMSPIDINFLIGIGLRALIEACWKNKILLSGIAKDSASAYLTSNYLGVCRLLNVYPELSSNSYGPIPPTDRLFCEVLPYLGSEEEDFLCDPWGTIEFDSAFMTLYAKKDDGGKEIITGTYGSIVRPERIFLRSVAQFYSRKRGETIITGHAIFVDRLAYPELDLKYSQTLTIEPPQIGRMDLMLFKNKDIFNLGQIITYFLLEVVTRNHFPEVIGYPDPLHKADLGAKAMRDNVKNLLKSSEWRFRSQPLTDTFRTIRQSFRRK